METEAKITVNGHSLTDAQALVVRLAIADFLMSMAVPDALGSDAHGRSMARAFRARASEIQDLLLARIPA